MSIRVSEHIHCAPQKPHTTAQQGALSVSNHTNNSRDNRHGRQPLTPSGARHRISGPTGNPGAELNRSSSLGCHPTAAPASSNTKSRGVNRPSSRSSLSERVQTRTPISTTQSHGRRKAVTSLEQQARLNTFPSSTSSVQNQTQVGSNQVLQERATSNDTVIPVWQEPIVPGSFAERNIPRGVRRPKVRNTISFLQAPTYFEAGEEARTTSYTVPAVFRYIPSLDSTYQWSGCVANPNYPA